MAILKYTDQLGREHVINPYWCQNVEVLQETGDSPYAVMSQDAVTKLLKNLDLLTITNVEYVKEEKRINFLHDSTVLAWIDVTDFVKDGMVKRVEIIGTNLEIEFNTDAEKDTIKVPLTGIFNPENYYTKDEIDRLVVEINANVELHTNDIRFIKGQLEIFTDRIEDMRNDISHIQDDLVVLRNNDNQFKQDRDNAYTQIDQINKDINHINDKIQHLEDDDDDIRNQVTILEGKHDAETTVNKQNISKISDALDQEIIRAKAEEEIIRNSIAGYINKVEYDRADKRINFIHDQKVIAWVDATDFVKDGMVSSVQIINDNLEIDFNTDAEQEKIVIPISAIFNADNYYTKSEVDRKITEINGQVTALNNEVIYIKGQFTYYTEKFAEVHDEITHLQEDVVEIRADYDGLKKTNDNLATSINQMQNDVKDVNDRIDHVNDDINDVQSKLADKVGRSEFNQTVDNLQHDIDTIRESNVDDLKNKLASLESRTKWYEY